MTGAGCAVTEVIVAAKTLRLIVLASIVVYIVVVLVMEIRVRAQASQEGTDPSSLGTLDQ